MITRITKLAIRPAGASVIFGKNFLSMTPVGKCHKRSITSDPQACSIRGSILLERTVREEIGERILERRRERIGYFSPYGQGL